MSARTPAQLGAILKSRRPALLLAGSLCDEVDFSGKKLLDYAVEIARKLHMPVAATGNTALGFRARGVSNLKKAWATEVAELLRGPWRDPISPQKPALVVLIGYSPGVAASLAAAMWGVETLSLGSAYVPQATYSLPESASFVAWEDSLRELVEALDK